MTGVDPELLSFIASDAERRRASGAPIHLYGRGVDGQPIVTPWWESARPPTFRERHRLEIAIGAGALMLAVPVLILLGVALFGR